MYKSPYNNRGYFGLAIYHPKKEANVGTLMRSAYCFSADFLCTIGRRYSKEASDTTCADKHIPLFHFESVEDFKNHLPKNCQLIGCELDKRASHLNHFQHPESACYLVGAEDYGLPEKILSICNNIVVIPHVQMCLNVATAGSIVIYDRIMKRQSIRPQKANKWIKEWEVDI